MKLWLLTQDTVYGYDTFDSCVVAADTEEEARKIHPSLKWGPVTDITKWYNGRDWAKPEDVIVAYLGTTDRTFDNPVICASYNAG